MPPTVRVRRALGFGMLGATILLWVGSSTVLQMIFESRSFRYEKPIFVTLFNSAASSTLLLPSVVRNCGLGSCKLAPQRKGTSLGFVQSSDDLWADTTTACLPRGTIWLSATVGILWLSAQMLFNWSLLHTCVSTSTVLSSTSSVFTFVFSMLICHDAFKLQTLGAAIASCIGCMLVVFHSPQNVTDEAVKNSDLGNALTLTAAAMFSLVSVMLRKLAPAELDLSQFMGVNGLMSTCISPLLLYAAHCLGVESFIKPTRATLMFLSINALFGCTIANYLYTSAMLLLSPLVATIFMSLSIPVSAFVDEILLRQHRFSFLWLIGAGFIASGVILAALDLEESTGNANGVVGWRGVTEPYYVVDDSPTGRYRVEISSAELHEFQSLLHAEMELADDGKSEHDDDVMSADWRDGFDSDEVDVGCREYGKKAIPLVHRCDARNGFSRRVRLKTFD